MSKLFYCWPFWLVVSLTILCILISKYHSKQEVKPSTHASNHIDDLTDSFNFQKINWFVKIFLDLSHFFVLFCNFMYKSTIFRRLEPWFFELSEKTCQGKVCWNNDKLCQTLFSQVHINFFVSGQTNYQVIENTIYLHCLCDFRGNFHNHIVTGFSHIPGLWELVDPWYSVHYQNQPKYGIWFKKKKRKKKRSRKRLKRKV